MGIEKSAGCNKMSCRFGIEVVQQLPSVLQLTNQLQPLATDAVSCSNCGCKFCYRCLKDITEEGYDHFGSNS